MSSVSDIIRTFISKEDLLPLLNLLNISEDPLARSLLNQFLDGPQRHCVHAEERNALNNIGALPAIVADIPVLPQNITPPHLLVIEPQVEHLAIPEDAPEIEHAVVPQKPKKAKKYTEWVGFDVIAAGAGIETKPSDWTIKQVRRYCKDNGINAAVRVSSGNGQWYLAKVGMTHEEIEERYKHPTLGKGQHGSLYTTYVFH